MRRTWYQPTSGAPPFRNCPLINDDRHLLLNQLLPWRQAALTREWDETFSRGVMRPDSEFNPAQPGPRDRFIPYDDSREATDAWVRNFLATGKPPV